ncbi:MAG: efflux RND transporter permease subunit, partial [Granulosicoccaceae bacterium]
GTAIADVEMDDGADMARFLDDVKSEVEAVRNFPAEAEDPVVVEINRTDMVAKIAITGPMSDRDLKAYAEQLKARLKRQPQVSLVSVEGFSDHQFRIDVSEQALRAYGLSLTSLASTLKNQGVSLPAGSLEGGSREWLVRFTDERSSVNGLADLVVLSNDSGAELRLGDVAHVTDRFEQAETRTEYQGRRAALLSVSKNKSEDTLTVMAEVEKFLAQEAAVAPAGVEIAITQDMSSIVSDRLNMLLKNGAQGLVLVFVVMALFFRMRFAFWVTMGLPVSFLAGMMGMVLMGMSINMITLVALLVALGLLMDDAIVIAENIAANLAKGKSAMQAAIDGTTEVMPGVISSFVTTVCVFLPLSYLAGDMGKVLGVLPIALLSVLSVSLVEAFFILPSHLGHSLAQVDLKNQSRFRHRFDGLVEHFRERWVGRAVDAAIRNRYVFLGVVLALMLASVGMVAGAKLKFIGFPSVEGDNLQARVLLPQGTPLWQTQQVVEQVLSGSRMLNEQYQPQQPDGQNLVQATTVQYGVNSDSNESGAHLATVSLDLLSAELRSGDMNSFIASWRESVGDLPDVIALTYAEPSLGPAGKAVDIRLQGDDLSELKQVADALRLELSSFVGVRNISDDLRSGKPELRLKLKDGAFALGVSANTVAAELRAALSGTTVQEVQQGVETYEIDLRYAADGRDQLADLESFRVTLTDGSQVPLLELVDVEQGRGWARINRVDGVRTIAVKADVDTRIGNASQIVSTVQSQFLPSLLEQYPSVTVRQEGESKESAATLQSLLRALVIGLGGIFVLLAFQFRNYAQPVTVMAIIPLGFIGVVWGHLLMGLNLSMPSMMGFVSLAGIAVNDSILLMEFVKKEMRAGL